jgi:hypothetical protein
VGAITISAAGGSYKNYRATLEARLLLGHCAGSDISFYWVGAAAFACGVSTIAGCAGAVVRVVMGNILRATKIAQQWETTAFLLTYNPINKATATWWS